jgi:hypothetical protein
MNADTREPTPLALIFVILYGTPTHPRWRWFRLETVVQSHVRLEDGFRGGIRPVWIRFWALRVLHLVCRLKACLPELLRPSRKVPIGRIVDPLLLCLQLLNHVDDLWIGISGLSKGS